jgi:hypothetical protein
LSDNRIVFVTCLVLNYRCLGSFESKQTQVIIKKATIWWYFFPKETQQSPIKTKLEAFLMQNKERVLVMNGQRLLEMEVSNKWAVKEVKPADGLKPGIYNIYNAVNADKTSATNGVILHVDKNNLYQMTGKDKFVKHDVRDFQTVPTVGNTVEISYSSGQANSVLSSGLSKSRSR